MDAVVFSLKRNNVKKKYEKNVHTFKKLYIYECREITCAQSLML